MTNRSYGALVALVGAVLLAIAPLARAAEDGPADLEKPFTDPVLDELISQSLEARPELGQARAVAAAAEAEVPQAGALPDPMLELGIQNDGFDGIEIGEMPTSFYRIGVSQGLPWPGKRRLRTEVARAGAEQADALVDRVRLSTVADVRRGYLDLLLVRDRLRLLDALEALWEQAAGIARTRYEAGEAAQSDVLRSQLELNRIRQRRALLRAEERTLVQTLNRLRAHPLDEPIETPSEIRDLEVPDPAPLEEVLADAVERSPELAAARLGIVQAEKAVALARRERYPDFVVGAAVMPRGSLDPMWQATVGFNLPIFAGRKQNEAVAEQKARAKADVLDAAAIEQILALRVAERRTALAALLETIRIFEDGLLVQSRATAESTLAQYQVGRVTFASVLEANAGYLADEDDHLAALAEATRLRIAAAEVSLEPVVVAAGGVAPPVTPEPASVPRAR